MNYFKPPVGDTVHYLDVNNTQRHLVCTEHLARTVKWHEQKPESFVSLYRCEDGHLIQIPDNGWSNVQVLIVERKKR